MTGTKSFRAALALCGTVFLPTACDDAARPIGTPVLARTVTSTGNGFVRMEGGAAGALFATIRPDDWNGDLVVLMHGAVPEGAPISLDPPLHWFFDPVVDALVNRGFGVAFSSYRVSGFAVREGTIDTRVAEAQFTAAFGEPAGVYLVGWSMGTHIGQKLVETSPGRYAGFLSVCGSLGGAPLQIRRFLDARVLFDYYFPGVLPGNVLTSDLDFAQHVIPRVVPAVMANPGAAVKLASLDQLQLRWSNPQELVFGIVGSLLGSANTQILQERAHGLPFDNTGTVYTSPLLTAAELTALNDGVGRFTGDPQALRYLETNYAPDGTLGDTKVLSLHTTRDPIVPEQLHTPAWQQVLSAAGTQHLWVRRLIAGFGHCEFGLDNQPDPFLDRQLAAFDDLVAWVRTGVAPAP